MVNAASDGSDRNPLPHFYVKYLGKEWKVFKREDRREAPYYVAPEKGGVRYRRCLGVNVQDLAEPKAKEVIELVLSGRIDELNEKKLRAPVKRTPAGVVVPISLAKQIATVGQVIDAFEKEARGFLKGRTPGSYVNALRMVAREGLGEPEMENRLVDRLRCDVFTGGLVARFERARLQALPAATEADEDAEDVRQRALTTINSIVRAARSVFKEKRRRAYVRDYGLLLPDLADFLEDELEQPARTMKEAAPADLIAKTFAEAAKLKVSAPAEYCALLMAMVSLRRGECQRARRSWIQSETVITPQHPAGVTWFFFRVPRIQKGKIVRVVPIPAAIAQELIAYWAETSPARPEWDREFILPGVDRGSGGPGCVSRAQKIVERVSEWMRGLGWETNHTMHELRAHYLRELRKVCGLEVAAEVGGHADPRVTRTNYTGQLDVKGMAVALPLMIGGGK